MACYDVKKKTLTGAGVFLKMEFPGAPLEDTALANLPRWF
jgi:hypothetical protein